VRVRNANGVSGTDTVTLQARAPRLFSKTQDGKGEAIILHANCSLVSSASPAAPGEGRVRRHGAVFRRPLRCRPALSAAASPR
jgi:uncharacterized protein (TIGR03437 family)